jgi:hypothetical protein
VTQQEFFEVVLATLERLRIPYMMTGSVAAMVHGVPRMTNDLDVIVALLPSHRDAFLSALDSEDFYVPPRESILDEMGYRGQFNIIHIESGSKVDFIFRKNTEFAKEEFGRRRRVQFTQELETVSASPEDVILSKLDFYRMGGSQKHLDDIAGMLQVSGDEIDLDYIDRWAERLDLTIRWAEAKSRRSPS